MVKQKSIWICKECGHQQHKWSGSCTLCKQWNTFTEEVQANPSASRFESKTEREAKPVRIGDVPNKNLSRIKGNYFEFDRLVGGGIVVGSLNLLGGEPGIGKSTFLLQLAKKYADQGLVILYVCGEESVEQTSLRAKRLGIESDRIFLLSETLFSAIHRQIEIIKPDFLIIDSIQIMYKGEISSIPGSVSQVREVTLECMHLAKGLQITTFLIGHVTKSGDLAGPRVLEHLVDTVFEFEGDREHGYRLLRSIKNRFGPTEDVALFQMGEKGLVEVLSPSEVFLQERMRDAAGSIIIPTIEGTRALLMEIQALVTASAFSTASRRSTGVDPKRLTLLLAVLEKRMGYKLHSLDVFVSVAGGMKIAEPAIDLGVLLAIASSYSNRPIPADMVVIGEVGLGGEVRSVPRIESRLKEAINMGFTKCLLPARAIPNLGETFSKKISLYGVLRVEEAIAKLLVGKEKVLT